MLKPTRQQDTTSIFFSLKASLCRESMVGHVLISLRWCDGLYQTLQGHRLCGDSLLSQILRGRCVVCYELHFVRKTWFTTCSLISVDRGDQTVLPKGGLHGSTMTSSLLTLWCTRIQLDKPVRLNRPDTKMELCVVMDFPLSRKHGLPRGMLIMK